MKLSPRHYRLLSILIERESVPVGLSPLAMEHLLAQNLVERFSDCQTSPKKDRYRITEHGRKLLDEYNERVRIDQLQGPWQGRKNAGYNAL